MITVMGKMQACGDAGGTTGKMWGELWGTAHILRTCSVIAKVIVRG